MKKGINLAEKNGLWKGDNVGLSGLHSWVKKRLDKPKRCEVCRKIRKLDMTNISGNYLRDLMDWKWLCRKCHMQSDGRIKNLLQGSKNRKLKPCKVCGTETNRIKFCIKCAKEQRRLWWKQYNQTPKRIKYQKNRRKK